MANQVLRLLALPVRDRSVASFANAAQAKEIDADMLLIERPLRKRFGVKFVACVAEVACSNDPAPKGFGGSGAASANTVIDPIYLLPVWAQPVIPPQGHNMRNIELSHDV